MAREDELSASVVVVLVVSSGRPSYLWLPRSARLQGVALILGTSAATNPLNHTTPIKLYRNLVTLGKPPASLPSELLLVDT